MISPEKLAALKDKIFAVWWCKDIIIFSSWDESENSFSNRFYIIKEISLPKGNQIREWRLEQICWFLIHCKGYVGIRVYLHKSFLWLLVWPQQSDCLGYLDLTPYKLCDEAHYLISLQAGNRNSTHLIGLLGRQDENMHVMLFHLPSPAWLTSCY